MRSVEGGAGDEVTDPNSAGGHARPTVSWGPGGLSEVLVAEAVEPITVFEPIIGPDGELVDLVFAFANRAACEYNRMTVEELIGQRVLELFPAMADSPSMGMYRRALDTGDTIVLYAQPYPSEVHGGQERLFDIRIGRVGEYLFSVWLDVTERVASLRRAEVLNGYLAEAEQLAHLGSWAWDISTGDLWWSDEVYRVFGCEPLQFPVTYDSFMAFIHADDRAAVERAIGLAVAGTADYDVIHRIVRPSGEVRTVRERGRVTRDDHGEPVRMLGIVHDITTEYNLRRELQESEARYRLLSENAWDILWTKTLDGAVTYITDSVRRVRGFTPQEAADQPLDAMHTPESAAIVKDYLSRVSTAVKAGTPPPSLHADLEYYRKDGSVLVGDTRITPQLDDSGGFVQLLGVTRDISSQREAEAELRRQAATDPLTGVWNRRHAQAMLKAEISLSHRYGTPLSLLMLDLDHFKLVNDRYGHGVGDEVLAAVSARLTGHLRASDFLARWGGEEFVVVLRNCAFDAACAMGERVRALVADTSVHDGVTLTVSVGVTELMGDDTLDSFLGRADKALYDAKEAGRNTVRARR